METPPTPTPQNDLGTATLPQSMEELKAKIAAAKDLAAQKGIRYRPTKDIVAGMRKFGLGESREIGGAPRPSAPSGPAPEILTDESVKQFVSMPFNLWAIVHPYEFIPLGADEAAALASASKPLLNEYAATNPRAFGLLSISVTLTALVSARIYLLWAARREERRQATIAAQTPPPEPKDGPGAKGS